MNLKSLVGKSAGAVGKAVTKSTIGVSKVVTKSTIGVGKVAFKGTKQIGKTMLTAISDSPDKRATQIQEGHANIRPNSLEAHEAPAKTASPGAMGYDAGSC